MGAADDEAAQPVHNVALNDYYVGQTEVTRDMWFDVMGSPSDWANNIAPVNYRSYEEIHSFIETLNSMTGYRFRLPTEAEWEYAARGGRRTHGYLYSGSNNVNDVAVLWNSYAVQTKDPNELGLYDMSGDVAEYCSDWYGPYPEESVVNPTGPETGQFHVIRGGHHYDDDYYLRVSTRSSEERLGNSSDALGFRLVLDVPMFTSDSRYIYAN